MTKQHIPSLDGLRAVAIGIVIFSHLAGTVGFPVGALVDEFGILGVRVFFVISGFLITSLLIKEEQRHGKVSFKKFYVRRTLRIFPAYFTYILVMLMLHLIGVIHVEQDDFIYAATYTMNYNPTPGWWLGHGWSLGVEEQFYLLWPAVLVLVGARNAVYLGLLFLLLAPVARVLSWHAFPEYHDGIGVTFVTTADSIVTGCVLAAWREQLWGNRIYRWVLGSPILMIGTVLTVIAANQGDTHPHLYFGVCYTIMNVGIMMLVDWSIRNSESLPGKILNARPVMWIGQLSYSLYLWQQPFLNHRVHTTVTSFPLNLGLSFAAAVASYYLVEQPFLRLKSRFSV